MSYAESIKKLKSLYFTFECSVFFLLNFYKIAFYEVALLDNAFFTSFFHLLLFLLPYLIYY